MHTHMMYWGYGYGPGFGILGGIVTILFWILIAWLIVSVIRRVRWHDMHDHEWNHHVHSHKNSALDILKERYAKGEINKEEFEQKKKDLMM